MCPWIKLLNNHVFQAMYCFSSSVPLSANWTYAIMEVWLLWFNVAGNTLLLGLDILPQLLQVKCFLCSMYKLLFSNICKMSNSFKTNLGVCKMQYKSNEMFSVVNIYMNFQGKWLCLSYANIDKCKWISLFFYFIY